VQRRLGAAQTQEVLQVLAGWYRVTVGELLITPLVGALGRLTGQRRLVIAVEGHGREGAASGLATDRTVGWFTTVYPVLYGWEGSDVLQVLQGVKQSQRRVPNQGIGYGLLRHLNGDAGVRARLSAQPEAQVTFEYLGQFDQVLAPGAGWGLAPEGVGETRAPEARRPYELNVTGAVLGGELALSFAYSAGCYAAGTIERIADDYLQLLQELLERQRAGQRAYAPADFPKVKLDKAALDRTVARLKKRTNVK